MRHALLAFAVATLIAAPAIAADGAQPPKHKSAQEIIDAAPASA